MTVQGDLGGLVLPEAMEEQKRSELVHAKTRRRNFLPLSADLDV